MEHIYFISFGKDSMAGLHLAIDILHWPVDRVVHSPVWATAEINACSQEMESFKEHACAEIKRRWGLDVEYTEPKHTFEELFYAPYTQKRPENQRTTIRGWPLLKGSWCSRDLKRAVPKPKAAETHYIAIAVEETNRHNQLNKRKKSPLVEAGWTEAMCYDWCKENNLLAPTYKSAARDGCWFCPKQPIEQLRRLYHERPDLWSLLLKWDADSPVTFKAGHTDKKTGAFVPGHTVHDFDRRFALEDAGKVPTDRRFKWSMVKEVTPDG